MTAAAYRASLFAIGHDIVMAQGDASARRVAGLIGFGSEPPPTTFDDLSAAPEWLRWPRIEHERLARAVALRSIASALATSIDGAWLGRLAAEADEETLDWAIAECDPDETPLAGEIDAGGLAAEGFALLRAGLPPALRGYFRSTDADVAPAARPAIVNAALTFIAERPQ